MGRYLASLTEAPATLSFARIEAIMNDGLAASARRHPAWWANDAGRRHVQAQAWLDAGWRVASVDLDQESVTFDRSG